MYLKLFVGTGGSTVNISACSKSWPKGIAATATLSGPGGTTDTRTDLVAFLFHSSFTCQGLRVSCQPNVRAGSELCSGADCEVLVDIPSSGMGALVMHKLEAFRG